MTVRELAFELLALKPELLDKEVTVRAPNGLSVRPEIKFILKDPSNFDKTKENVEEVVVTW